MNSAAMRFIALEDLEKEGYGEYRKLFEQDNATMETATFGAGCFWGVQAIYKKIPGVVKTVAGYMGGSKENPSYQEVSTGNTGYAEVVQVTYDPEKVSYKTLLQYFFRLHDPTTPDQQGPNYGSQYRSVIFFHDEAQKQIALDYKMEFDASKVFKNNAVTEILGEKRFYPAEDYHQDWYDKKGGPICHTLRLK
jgi:methionine-S-sulfoxide reductase